MYVLFTILGVVLGLMIMIWGIAGLIKPSWANQSTRKKVVINNFGLGFLILVVSIILSPDPLELDQSTNVLVSTSLRSVDDKIEKNKTELRGDFDAKKIFARIKSDIDQYLGEPKKCIELTDSVFCEYEWLGTEIYFDKQNRMSRAVSVTTLPPLNFRGKATREIGIKIDGKPNFSNEFVIKWDYFEGKEISITSDTDNTSLVSSIHIKAVPLTVSYTASAGVPVSGVVAFALEHFYEELNDRDHNDIAILNLYMDGLIDEYGNKIDPRLTHAYKLSADETKDLRRYKNKNLFHSKRNKFHMSFREELAEVSSAKRFWPNR